MQETSKMYNDTKFNSTEISIPSTYQGNKLVFSVFAIMLSCIGLIAAAANSMVLYIVSLNRNQGPLKSLDNVIKSLLIADMLFGLIGIPCRLTSFYYVGKITNVYSYVYGFLFVFLV